MRLLLISNSTMAGQAYLEYPKKEIARFLGDSPVEALFIPYAAVTFSYEVYENKVNERFHELGHSVVSVHRFARPVDAVAQAKTIVVGGGNTWQLLRVMREQGILPVMAKKVREGTPYIGWSAGSNVACPTIQTTNDMPVCDPGGMDALCLIPFQINPHYLDTHPDGHAGETREQRIEEYIELNPQRYVVGLREASMLLYERNHLNLIGDKTLRIFKKGTSPVEMKAGADLSFLMNG
ncbi:MAG TPA: dipeptidase PepE [Prolixibacteraceae bacterium]|nr:dipeptidase PepE [Prolixibacteraceae bacterium]